MAKEELQTIEDLFVGLENATCALAFVLQSAALQKPENENLQGTLRAIHSYIISLADKCNDLMKL